MSTDQKEKAELVRAKVREGYSEIARAGNRREQEAADGGCCSGTSCCGSTESDSQALAEKIGYTEEELARLPEGANMGLSCGNPTAIASLQPGEVMLDLGSGGGFDAFLAGPKVGASGRVIGVDMNHDMLSMARKNTTVYQERTKLDNVEFRLGEIEHIPVADRSVDVVISNCVINLSPDKPQVWRDTFRVLRPGGRIAVSDLALRKQLPAEVEGMVEALVGCVAGAELIEETRRSLTDAGFEQIELREKPEYAKAMNDFSDPLYKKIAEALPDGDTPGDYITSLDISARRPSQG